MLYDHAIVDIFLEVLPGEEATYNNDMYSLLVQQHIQNLTYRARAQHETS